MTPERIEQLLSLLPELEQFLRASVQPESLSFDNPNWPAAVPVELICDTVSEDDKADRAKNIINTMPVDITGKKFLDFGCGEGHVVAQAKRRTTLAVGYDPVKQGSLDWEQLSLTTNFDNVKANAPYDVILLYDVIDHVTDPVAALSLLKTVCSPTTKLVVRCHPWCGRHGGHAYTAYNKAFAHLFLTEQEMVDKGIKAPVQKVIHPRATYEDWFYRAGFGIDSHSEELVEVEPFFQRSPLREIILKHWQSSPDQELSSGRTFPTYQLSQCHHTYVLSLL